jgi:hypothetical protein
LQYQGAASCATAGCHQHTGAAAKSGCEYTTWAVQDPHAQAYAVLAGERSRRIVRNLKGLPNPRRARPEKEPRCLGCHVLPGFRFGQTRRRDRFAVSDGVGCEACHGPAEKWLHTHYRKSWAGEGPGFRRTKDLGVRAELCVTCHVGRKDLDVNHDLIAAGHPRLRFDFAAYLAVYPRHWSEAADRRDRPDFAARAWLLGKLVCAEAAADLLAHRAAQAIKNKAPWPEFSEYECAACHHGLKAESDRWRRGRPGSLPWGTWYFALLPRLSRQTRGGGFLKRESLEGLERSMRAGLPREQDVLRKSKRVAAQVRGWRAAVEKAGRLDPAAVRRLLASLAEDDRAVRAGWEEATQLYLALAALNPALADLDPDHRDRPGLSQALRALGEELARAFPKGGDSLFGSPSNFKPDRLVARLEEVRKRLK